MMRLLKNKKAVSPVVGVILMVAITIVLAATIYIWISSMSSPAATAPTINFRGSVVQNGTGSGYNLTLTVISVQGNARWEDLTITYSINGNASQTVDLSGQNLSGAVNAGDQIIISNLNSGAEVTVQVVHNPSNSVIYENTLVVP